MSKHVPVASITELQPGTIILHRASGQSYVVTDNTGERATAVATVDVTNPDEWLRFDASADNGGEQP